VPRQPQEPDAHGGHADHADSHPGQAHSWASRTSIPPRLSEPPLSE
jgi:hypothetical protein